MLNTLLQHELQQELQPFLLLNERLLWTGRPQQGLIFENKDWFITFFMVFWTGFSVFWTVSASVMDGLFGLFGLPFVGVGVYMLIGRFFYDAKYRETMVYGVTNQRIIIRAGIFSKTVESLDIKSLPIIKLLQTDGTKGSILFGEAYTEGYGKNRRTVEPPQFKGIDDVVTVYQIIIQNTK